MSKQSVVQVEGMTCGHCEMAVSNAVKSVPGVTDAVASRESQSVTILHGDDLNFEEVVQKIEAAGYKASKAR